jgi:peptidoglycan/xylan/chitin deacetylase (PgdA/CDA1 family)
MRILCMFIFIFVTMQIDSAASNVQITWNKFEYNATSTTIYTKNTDSTIKEVTYRIWRTADGPKQAKTFTAKNKQKDFAFVIDTKQFQSQRGQYEVEAIGIKQNGVSVPLVKGVVIFQQYVPILMYHSIAEFKGTGLEELYVSPENFEEQVRYLKENDYTLLTFERWKDINNVNKPVFITLDDGYKNNLNAFKIFQKLKTEQFQPAATIFVVAGFIGRSNRLSEEDLHTMSQSGLFSIQSHTMFHPDLTKSTNNEYELKTSKETLQRITGKPVIAFAYPYGFWNEKVLEETKQYYNFAVTVQRGLFIEKGLPNEYYKLPRQFVMYKTTLEEFRRMLEAR